MKSRQSADIEAGGFVTTEETQTDLNNINLEETLPTARRILIVSRDDLPESDAPEKKWSAAGRVVDRCTLPGYADMMDVPHQTKVPLVALREIVRWVVAGSSVDGGGTVEVEPPKTALVLGRTDQQATDPGSMVMGDVRESAVQFGRNNDLFGVLSAPVGAAPVRTPTVLLPNAGSTHHVGPSRLYVLLSRRLSRAGFRCVRLDLPGLGDSVVDDPENENNPYVPESSAAIAAAMETLSQGPDAGSYVVMGLCSGAHTAFHAAIDLDRSSIVESVLINPLTFYYTPGMSLDQPPAQARTRWRRYVQASGTLRGWSKLFREDTDLARIAVDAFERVRVIVEERIDSLRFLRNDSRNDQAGAGDLAADITRMIDRRRRLAFIFSTFDPGYDLLMTGARRVVKPLCKLGHIKIWMIRDANHTFDRKAPRDELIESITSYMCQRYKPAGSA